MKCSACGYDNAPEALCCNLCQVVLRRETKPKPPPAVAATEEPTSLDSAEHFGDPETRELFRKEAQILVVEGHLKRRALALVPSARGQAEAAARACRAGLPPA